jgi:uncharacterized membrane protein
MTNYLLIALCVLLYLLSGVIFCVAYIWNFRTEAASARLGLLALFWPLMLVVDFVLSIAEAFGKATKKLAERGMRK